MSLQFVIQSLANSSEAVIASILENANSFLPRSFNDAPMW